jgi:outer membrane protein TolC
LLLVALALPAEADPTPTPDPAPAPADELLAGLDDATAALAAEVLERNPNVARARAQAVAAELRAPQLRSLDDPMAALTLFLLPPETRVGPQRFTVSVSQKLPWFGKLALREQAALYRAAAARAELEAERLRVLTEARGRLAELWFLDRHL